MPVGTLLMAKLTTLSNAEVISHLMSPRVKPLVVRQSHLLVKRQPKQIWEHQVNLHPNLQQIKVRQESLLESQEPLRHPLPRQLLVKNPLNLRPQLKKELPSLPLRLRDREGIRPFKNNPLIIKFLAQAPLAVRKPHLFNSRSPQKQAPLSCLNRVPLLLERGKLSLPLRSHLQSLSYNSRKLSSHKRRPELRASCTWSMRLLMILQEVSIALS